MKIQGADVLGAKNPIFFYRRCFTPFPRGDSGIGSRQCQAAAVHRVLEEPRLGGICLDSRREQFIRIAPGSGVLGCKETMGGQVQDVRTMQTQKGTLADLRSGKRFGLPGPLLKFGQQFIAFLLSASQCGKTKILDVAFFCTAKYAGTFQGRINTGELNNPISNFGLAITITSLPKAGWSSRNKSRPLVTYWIKYFSATKRSSGSSNVANERKLSCPSGLSITLSSGREAPVQLASISRGKASRGWPPSRLRFRDCALERDNV